MSKKVKATQLENKLDEVKLSIKEKIGLFDKVIIYPFLGYSNGEKSLIRGRVMEKKPIIHDDHEESDNLWMNIKKIVARYESDEIPHVQISATMGGNQAHTYADEEGYFEICMHHEKGELENGWNEVILEIESMPFDLDFIKSATGEILVCNQQADFGVISDVDDTIIQSHATNSFKKIYTLLKYNSESRTPFEGVEELYNLIVKENKNPLFFISGSSYNLYDLLVKFCKHHNIPKAPFLLRNLGLEKDKWFKHHTDEYKISYIENILAMYPELPFILIGDSGQKDPEIYGSICEKYPEQVKAIYIRHVDGDERLKEVETIGASLSVDFLVMEHSKEAIAHLEEKCWV